MLLNKNILLFLCVFILSFSCIRKITTTRGKDLLVKHETSIQLNTTFNKNVKVLYTGCGGLVISNGTSAVMTDPYYTGHNALHSPFGKIKIDTTKTDTVFKTISEKLLDPKLIKTVLVTHSHYDHLEDLPYLLSRNKLADSVKVIGSESTLFSIHNFLKSPATFTNADKHLYSQKPNGQEKLNWINLPGNMRVLPIESQHAPHLYCIKLMRGSTKNKKFEKRTDPKSKTKALQWKEGSTYSFLLDIFDVKKKDTLRIFIQTSACNPPYGFPPVAEIGKKKVDLAILCVASYAYVDNYPEALLSLIRPQKTILIHWDDFFTEMYSAKTKSVAGTNMLSFMKRLRKHYHVKDNKALDSFFVMPVPLTVLEVKY